MTPPAQASFELEGVEPTLGVAELCGLVSRAVSAAFPAEVWVRGEIRGWQVSRAGHAYFTLAEDVRGRSQPAELPVVLFASERQRIERRLRDVPEFSLGDGIEVRIRVRVGYYAGRSQVQLQMSAVDPVHTLGKLAADRSRVLRALAADGLLERNRSLPWPLLPLRVGLLTSEGSAAHADFVHEIERSGFGFEVVLVHARVQGRGAEGSVVRALRLLGASGCDVIAVVRGGGSRTDLATFDHEAVARAIAAAPVPVTTGIGHETDRSIADEVAHTACKTPTACAATLVAHVAAARDRAEAAWRRIGDLAAGRVRTADDHLVACARRAAADARRAVTLAEHQVVTAAGAVAGLSRARARDHDQRLARAAARLAPVRLESLLRPAERAAHEAGRRLRQAAPRPLAAGDARLDVATAKVAAADPARALARGWSITHDAGGRLVRRAADLTPGDELVTRFADGSARSRVEAVAPDDTSSPEEP